MNLKKVMLVAGMALAAVAVMAPMAQAEITHETESITEAITEPLHYEGVARFDAGPGVFLECPVTGELTIGAGGVPSVHSFSPSTTGCTGGGPFAGCIIGSHSFNAGAVHVNTDTPDLTVTNFTIRNNYVIPSCVGGIPATHLIFPEITLTPHNIDEDDPHHSMDTLTISGTAGNVEGTTGGPVASGLLHITEDEEGTYSLST